MPGKRARRHFSQLSEFERRLIIGMKTAGWSTRRFADRVARRIKHILNPSALSMHSLKTGTSATASTVVPSQINVECHRLAKGCVW
ncbi:hypothetical protein TNCV_1118751 [Trichonephila clavipes]|uniref:Transposase IS30-like HTH domain-containing protein n=1 Tax=Trichonephila clavipes TaxID=2585209 RepID=A0A8X6SYS4_TRICX|nr:hypothetical protein TNCV_1118751 [Trichonephila clavipes]